MNHLLLASTSSSNSHIQKPGTTKMEDNHPAHTPEPKKVTHSSDRTNSAENTESSDNMKQSTDSRPTDSSKEAGKGSSSAQIRKPPPKAKKPTNVNDPSHESKEETTQSPKPTPPSNRNLANSSDSNEKSRNGVPPPPPPSKPTAPSNRNLADSSDSNEKSRNGVPPPPPPSKPTPPSNRNLAYSSDSNEKSRNGLPPPPPPKPTAPSNKNLVNSPDPNETSRNELPPPLPSTKPTAYHKTHVNSSPISERLRDETIPPPPEISNPDSDTLKKDDMLDQMVCPSSPPLVKNRQPSSLKGDMKVSDDNVIEPESPSDNSRSSLAGNPPHVKPRTSLKSPIPPRPPKQHITQQESSQCLNQESKLTSQQEPDEAVPTNLSAQANSSKPPTHSKFECRFIFKTNIPPPISFTNMKKVYPSKRHINTGVKNGVNSNSAEIKPKHNLNQK